jgi:hypothetical protein
MANKANKAKGRIVKAVDKVLGEPRKEGPATRKKVTLYTPEAAKAAGKRYKESVEEGIAAGDKELTSTRVNPYSRTGREETQGEAMLKGNPFAKTSRGTKEGLKQAARNKRAGEAKPQRIKRISQTGTEVGTKARINKPQIQGSRELVEARGDDKGNVVIPGGRNNPIFDPKNVDKFYQKGEGVGEENKYQSSHAHEVKPRASEKTASKPAARPKTVVNVPAGKRMAISFTPNDPRIVDSPAPERSRGSMGLVTEPDAEERAELRAGN